MKKLPKDIQELLDNTPKMSKKSLKQLKKAAEELKNDSAFQKEVEEGVRENKKKMKPKLNLANFTPLNKNETLPS